MQIDPATVWTIVQGAATLGCGVLGWLWKQQADLIASIDLTLTVLARELADHKLHVAETYATKEGLETNIGYIREDLKEIKASLFKLLGQKND